jgi:predicted DNA-binding antitoxin AbrB/MazE fold protein
MQSILATFKDGVFTPSEPVKLPDGFQVRLWVDESPQTRQELLSEDREYLRALAAKRAEVFRRLAE